MNGSEWAAALPKQAGPERDRKILEAVRKGDFVITGWTALELKHNGHEIVVYVSDDAIRFGNREDSVRMATSARVSQLMCDDLACMLTTPLLCDQWWVHAKHKLGLHTQSPNPGGALAGILRCSAKLDAELVGRTGLAAPISKQHCLAEELWQGRERFTAIYGLQSDGHYLARSAGALPGVKVVQGLWDSDGDGDTDPYEKHIVDFVDYYTAFQRLVTRACYVDGRLDDLARVITDPELAPAINHDGALPGHRHPGVPAVRPSAEQPLWLPPGCAPPESATVAPPVPPAADTLPSSQPEPSTRPTRLLRLGLRGADVEQWRAQLAADGYSISAGDYFDRAVHNATVGWQGERNDPLDCEELTKDGIVGPASRRAVGTTPRPKPEPTADDEIVTMLARNYRKAGRDRVDAIVFHTAEAPEASTVAENLGRWVSGSSAPRASWHYGVDDDSVVRCVPEEDIAFAAPGANRYGIQIEHAGYARQTAAQWADPFSERMLQRSAQLCAAICERWSIPVQFVDAAALNEGRAARDRGATVPSHCRGITTHAEVTNGPGKGRTSHTDPGKHWPRERYLALVKAALAGLG